MNTHRVVFLETDMKTQIRQANLNDLNSLISLEQESFNKKKYHLTNPRQFKYLLTKANAEIWLAEIDNEIIGMSVLLFRRNTHTARLYSICVSPSKQGGNIGKDLFIHAQQRTKAKNLGTMSLEIRSDNTKHRQRYTALGYVQTKILPDYYPDGCSGIKMKKTPL